MTKFSSNALKKYKNYLIAILVLTTISALFVPSNFSGKSPEQSDIIQYKGAASEIKYYKKEFDEKIHWTNSLFSGMPTYVIAGEASSKFISSLILPSTPKLWSILFKYFICIFFLLIAFKVRPWLAMIGAIGMALATENLTILEVGHITKARAISYLPLILAGCHWLYRKKWLLGLTVLSVGFGLQIYSNHLQITYYGGLLIILYFLFQFINSIRKGNIRTFAIAGGLAALGAIIALGANSLNLLILQEYAEVSIRGKSEITITKDGSSASENIKDGLTKDYTFSYSNGWPDIAATIIPNYAGGDSDKLGLYYGGIGSTSGPKYIGATIFILMILGLVLIKGPKKWWLVTTMIITIILSMGGNHFTGINNFMYEHFPLYNKFRAPSMMMVLVQISAGLLAILGVEKLLSNPEEAKADFKKLKIASISGIGVLILLTFTGTLLNDFSSTPKYNEQGIVEYDADTRYAQMVIQRQGAQPTQQNIDRFKDQLVEMRLDAMKKDGYRSIFFALAILVVLWLGFLNKIENRYVLILLGLLVTADLWFVGKRYLDHKEFKKKRTLEQPFQPYQVDLEILKDKSYYRVLDLTQSTLNSNRCAYFHKSIGGYSAAKIRRYQDLWDWHLIDDLQKGNIMDNGILSMLNMKYFIYPNQQQQGGPPRYGQNPKALGNAWFVPNISIVDNADSAILALGELNTAKYGIVEKEHADRISTNSSLDSSARISLLSYHPEKLEYEYTSAEESNIAFSEVYYDKGWKAYLDGEEIPYFRLNYIIRGIKAPAGNHKVTFKFEPETYKLGKTISSAFGIVIYILLVASIFMWVRREFFTKQNEVAV